MYLQNQCQNDFRVKSKITRIRDIHFFVKAAHCCGLAVQTGRKKKEIFYQSKIAIV